MDILFIFLVWMVAPFAELVAIIVLCIINQKDKQRIRELEQQNQTEKSVSAPSVHLKSRQTSGYGKPPEISLIMEQTPEKMNQKQPSRKKEKKVPNRQGALGMIALITGVIFIVFSGLIFATTTWRNLPDFGKVFLVLAGAVLFFLASWMAEKRLHIHKTSNAFYLLGSIFLFLTVLAAAYFKLLGSEFVLEGQNRWKVLWCGSFVMECAFFAGLKQFHDRIFTQTTLWGVSVNLFFLTNALGLKNRYLLYLLALYAFCLVIGEEYIEHRTGKETEFCRFVPWHFFVLGVLVMVQGWTEIAKYRENLSVIGAGSMTAVATGMGFYAWKKKTEKQTYLFAGSMAECITYTAFSLPADRIYQLCFACAAFYLWFWIGKKKKGVWAEEACIVFLSSFLIADTGFAFFLSILNSEGILELIAAAGSVLLLAAMMAQQGKTNKILRIFVPAVLWLLTILAYVVWERAKGARIGGYPYEILMFFFLCAIMLWDIKKNDEFLPFILFSGTFAQIFSFFWREKSLPFFLLLAVYLQITGKERKKKIFSQAGIVYSLAGAYFLMCYVSEREVIRASAGNLLFPFFQLICRKRGESRESRHTLFWEMCGCIVSLFTIFSNYRDEEGGVIALLFCLLSFGGYYFWLYRGKRQWLHLLLAVSVLHLPFILIPRFSITINQNYLLVMLALLGTGIPARWYCPIIKKEKEVQGGWRIDWYHVLAVFILLAMMAYGNRRWQFVYLLLTSLYFLTYAAVPEWKKWAVCLSAFCLSAAFWEQPFLQWPDLISLEMMLLPAAFLLGVSRICWKGKTAGILQTAGCLICLAILGIDAVLGGLVGDALILEGICFLIFIGAQIKKNEKWVRISSAVMIGIVIFMTKEFWLSISWWIYLFAAGIGLMIFAAVNEKKKR